jgi:hypothetical protein
MSTFQVKSESTGPVTSSEFNVEVPDDVGAQYITLAQGAVALLFTKLGELTIQSEGDGSKLLADGDALMSKINDA